MPKKIKCSLCEEEIENENNVYYDLKGKRACEGCFNNDLEQPSIVIKFSPNKEPEIKQFSENFGDLENLGEGYPIPIKKEFWVSTSAWRGYTDWEYLKGYKEIVDGWITGYPDETIKRKTILARIYDDLIKGKTHPPCEIFWIFGKTSNVFSTASGIVTRKGNEKIVDKWLKEIDGGIQGIQEMLN